MVLFTRNPRLRTLAQIYGFFLVIGSGTAHILRTSRLHIDRKQIVGFIETQIDSYKAGNSPVHDFLAFHQRHSLRTTQSVTTHPALREAYALAATRQQAKQHTITEELLVRKGLEDRLKV